MPPNLGQTNIKRKLRKYVEIQKKRRPFQKVYNTTQVSSLLQYLEKGHCSGFSALYHFYKDKDTESIFFGNLRLVSEWNETEKDLEESPVLQSVFEQWINDARWLQQAADAKVSDIAQADYPTLFEGIKQKDSKVTIEKEFNMSFIFKERELIETLKHVIKPGKMIRLGCSLDHIISIFLRDGIYYLYDSNERNYNEATNSNEVTVDSIEKLVPFIKNDLFEYIKGKAHKDKVLTNLPIEINVYDFSDKEKGKYELSSSELVAKISLLWPTISLIHIKNILRKLVKQIMILIFES